MAICCYLFCLVKIFLSAANTRGRVIIGKPMDTVWMLCWLLTHTVFDFNNQAAARKISKFRTFERNRKLSEIGVQPCHWYYWKTRDWDGDYGNLLGWRGAICALSSSDSAPAGIWRQHLLSETPLIWSTATQLSKPGLPTKRFVYLFVCCYNNTISAKYMTQVLPLKYLMKFL